MNTRYLLVPGLFAIASLVIPLGCSRPQSEEKVLRMAYVNGPTELMHRAAGVFARRVEERSDGRIRVQLYPSGQLGNERELVEGLKLGSVDMVVTGLAIIGWYAPEYGVTESPFIWRDYVHVETVWNGEVGQELRQAIFEKSGTRLLQPWYRGPRYLTTTNKKIQHPGDLKGLKLRVPELDVYIKSWQTFGANVTPLPFTDMFMALKLGVVEGQENPLATIYGNNLHEVQKYIMQTEHLIGFYTPVIGPYFERRFDEDERKIVLEALDHATKWHNREVGRAEAEYREKIEAAGCEFVPVDREAFRKLAKEKIPKMFEKSWKPGLYRRVIEAR
jgi:tripartite ATP-independent transporter DctP family solute receptor